MKKLHEHISGCGTATVVGSHNLLVLYLQSKSILKYFQNLEYLVHLYTEIASIQLIGSIVMLKNDTQGSYGTSKIKTSPMCL